MDFFQIIVLALVQGMTEFLPVSSSAHLILVPIVTSWSDQGLAFDVAVHVGTLSAVVLYFRRQLISMARSWSASLVGRGFDEDARLAWAVLFATIPVGLAGLLFKDFIEASLRSPFVIATATLVFALLLWWADAKGRGQRSEYRIGWKDVLLIGVAQAFALIPGTSRSGVTMTAALETIDYLEHANIGDMQPLLIGALLSGVSAYFCIHYFLKLLERIGMMPFVIYRILLALLLYLVFA